MSVLYFLVPVALSLAALAALAFRWATHADQFDDLESPAIRMLSDGHVVDAVESSKDSA